MKGIIRASLDIGASIVTLAAGLVFIWVMLRPTRPPDGILLPRLPADLTNPRAGEGPNRSVVAVQYADFECPFSAQAAQETVPTLLREYADTGKIQWVFRHLPLPQHKLAFGAAVAAECAARQNRFWQMHNAIFADKRRLAPEQLLSTAEELRLDVDAFRTCVRDPATATVVQEDIRAGRAMRISKTPTLLLGRRTSDGRIKYFDSIEGAAPIDAFRAALDTAIANDTRPYLWPSLGATGVVVLGLAGWVTLRNARKKTRPGISQVAP